MSIEEQHRLGDIERYLRLADPDFVALFEQKPPRRRPVEAMRARLAPGLNPVGTAFLLLALVATVALVATASLGLAGPAAATGLVALAALWCAGSRRPPFHRPVARF